MRRQRPLRRQVAQRFQGRQRVDGASLGRFAAFVLMVIAVAIGLATLLATSQLVFEILKWAGVGYLAWIGVRALRDGFRPHQPRTGEQPARLGPLRLAAAAVGA